MVDEERIIMKYVIVAWMIGNGFEDEEGLDINDVFEVKDEKEGVKLLKKKFKEFKKLYFNNNCNVVKVKDYNGEEGSVCWMGDEFRMVMESEFGMKLMKVRKNCLIV